MEARIHFIGEEPWRFAVTPAAICALEELTRRRADAYVGDIRDAHARMYTRVYELGYALSATYRESKGLDLSFAQCRDLFPVGNPKCPDWTQFAVKMNDLVSLNFFGQTWTEHVGMWEALVQAATEAAEAEMRSAESLSETSGGATGDDGPTTSGDASDTAPTR